MYPSFVLTCTRWKHLLSPPCWKHLMSFCDNLCFQSHKCLSFSINAKENFRVQTFWKRRPSFSAGPRVLREPDMAVISPALQLAAILLLRNCGGHSVGCTNWVGWEMRRGRLRPSVRGERCFAQPKMGSGDAVSPFVSLCPTPPSLRRRISHAH